MQGKSIPSTLRLPVRQVGRTDLAVSALGFGSASIGNLYSDVSLDQAVETVHAALAQGITLIDTAPQYGILLVEERLGVALAGVPRDQYVLSTKVGRPTGTEEMDFSADAVKRSIDGSLKRLKVDRVDILHLHDPNTPEQCRQAIEEAYPVLADLRRQGVIKAVGVGVNQWEPLIDFARDADFDCFVLAGRYTLLEQGALNALNAFQRRGISIFAAGVYNTGILARGPKEGVWYQYRAAPQHIIDRVRALQAVCEEFGVELPAAAVQFVRAHPANTALIIGSESPAQLAQTLAWWQVPIPRAFWEALRARNLIDPAAPIPD